MIQNKDTKIFISISTNPGSTGSYFHNTAYKLHNLNNFYFPLKIKNLKNIKNLFKNYNVNGCSVSMPFKKKIVSLLDIKDKTVLVTNNTNTILIKKNKLIGFNTDFISSKIMLKKINIKDDIILLGNGAVAETIYASLCKIYLKKIYLCSRNKSKYKNWILKKNTKILNWSERNILQSNTLINATSIGMSQKINDCPIKKESISNFKNILDIVINENSMLKKYSKMHKIKYYSGKEFSFYQACEQFKIYCGINIDKKMIKKKLGYKF